MIDPLTALAFVPAALALNFTPGPDMMLCLAQGAQSGRRAAWGASAGISAGLMVHVSLAGLGLGAVIAAFPWAFEVIRWVGVAYLCYLAVQALRHRPHGAKGSGLTAARAFRAGFITNLTNFKVIWFVLAFIPQFVVPEAGPVLFQFLTFGGLLGLGGFVINGMVGVYAGSLGARILRSGRALGYVTGGIYAALAARLAVME